MRIVFTEAASRDLDDILQYLANHHPAQVELVERRVHSVLEHLASWPEAARRVAQRRHIRVIPLVRYPYKIFYRIVDDAIEVVHIRHSSRQPWGES